MFLSAIDGEQLSKMLTIWYFSFILLRLFDVLINYSASSSHKRIKLPPFDKSRLDTSNGSNFIFLSVMNGEQFGKMSKGRNNVNESAELLTFCSIVRHPLYLET